MDHTFHKCSADDCSICSGGLKWCKVCGGAEATLPTRCPGRPMTDWEAANVSTGRFDVNDDGFVIDESKPRPRSFEQDNQHESEPQALPADVDDECVALCNALNRLPGISTASSCCGHGEKPYRIWFTANNLESLPAAIYYLDKCHSGCDGWRALVVTDRSMSLVTFCVEGPIGDAAYKDANVIADRLISWLDRPQT